MDVVLLMFIVLLDLTYAAAAYASQNTSQTCMMASPETMKLSYAAVSIDTLRYVSPSALPHGVLVHAKVSLTKCIFTPSNETHRQSSKHLMVLAERRYLLVTTQGGNTRAIRLALLPFSAAVPKMY